MSVAHKHRRAISANGSSLELSKNEHLRRLCKEMLLERTCMNATMEASNASPGPQEIVGTRRRLRGAVQAVVFKNLLVKLRLKSLQKNTGGQRCEPYNILPAEQMLSTTADRRLLVFAGVVSSEDLFYFAIDRAPSGEGVAWQLYVDISPNHAALLSPHFLTIAQSSAPRQACNIKLLPLVISAQFNVGTTLLVPIAVESSLTLKNNILPMMRDFESRVNDPSDHSAVNTLHVDMKVSLPTGGELKNMPHEVQVAVIDMARSVLQRLLLPRLILKQRLKWRERMNQGHHNQLSTESVQKMQHFEMWPAQVLELLCRRAVPFCADRNELIFCEGETMSYCLFFLMSGVVQQTQKIIRTEKRLGTSNCQVMQGNITGPSCFGHLSLLIPDPRMTTLRTVTTCLLWRVYASDYLELFHRLPPLVQTMLRDAALQRRTQSIVYNIPLSAGLLRSLPIFSVCSENSLRALLSSFRPLSCPADTTITKSDSEGHSMYILLRGRCGTFRYLPDLRCEMHVDTVRPLASIGDDAVVGGGSFVSTVKTLEVSDFYVLSKEDFESCMSRFGAEWDAAVKQAAFAREARLLESQDRYKEMASNVPLASSILSTTARGELARLFKPHLYHPRQTVCSVAHYCDRVIIVVEGTVRFGDGRLWTCGEASGYSCVVPHRWQQHAVAVTSSKLIELHHADFCRLLHKHNALQKMQEAVRALMFPQAADPELLYWALQATRKLKNPIPYPVSDSEVAHFNEEGFGASIVAFGRLQERHSTRSTVPVLDEDVQRGLDKIEGRLKKMQLARGSSMVSNDSRLDKNRWIRSGLLIMPTIKVERRSVSQNRAVSNQIDEYRSNFRRPLGFKRPQSFSTIPFEDTL